MFAGQFHRTKAIFLWQGNPTIWAILPLDGIQGRPHCKSEMLFLDEKEAYMADSESFPS